MNPSLQTAAVRHWAVLEARKWNPDLSRQRGRPAQLMDHLQLHSLNFSLPPRSPRHPKWWKNADQPDILGPPARLTYDENFQQLA
ncbi:hypothetical protein MTO96_042946 [Rhipicephalus appendiculatus]